MSPKLEGAQMQTFQVGMLCLDGFPRKGLELSTVRWEQTITNIEYPLQIMKMRS